MSEQVQELQDIANKASRSTVAVIDAMTQRGAFKGAEAETVGTAFNKLVNLLKALAPEQPDETTTSEEE